MTNVWKKFKLSYKTKISAVLKNFPVKAGNTKHNEGILLSTYASGFFSTFTVGQCTSTKVMQKSAELKKSFPLFPHLPA